jgi:hypothetical protein
MVVVMDPSEAWPFEEPPNVAVFTSKHIIRQGKPVLLVSHDEDDGGWQFHYGGAVSDSDAMIVALREVFRRHPELAELADLPRGWKAERVGPGQP